MIDPRGPRFGAGITFFVLLLALILGPNHGWIPIAFQTLVFALGSIAGLKYQPYSWIYKSLVRPRLGPPTELEDERPPRFAQAVGLGFAAIALVGSFAGIDGLFYVGAGFALAASFLNWVFDFCLGCELYLLVRRLSGNPLKNRENAGEMRSAQGSLGES